LERRVETATLNDKNISFKNHFENLWICKRTDVSEAWAYIFFSNWYYLYFTTKYLAYNSLILRLMGVLIVHRVGWGGGWGSKYLYLFQDAKNRMSFVPEW
jgi:hypothetical protein